MTSIRIDNLKIKNYDDCTLYIEEEDNRIIFYLLRMFLFPNHYRMRTKFIEIYVEFIGWR